MQPRSCTEALNPAGRLARQTPRGGELGLAGALLGLGWHAYTRVESASFATTLGDIETQRLGDGSQATLASDSALDVHLSRRERRVELHRGEAIFDVAKDAGRPFVVDAGTRRIVAVGTRFSVRRDGGELRVVVTEGTVRLQPADGAARAPSSLLPAGSVATRG